MRLLERLFDPRGIAIVGASNDPTRISGQTLGALTQYGYGGGVYPVNPKYNEIGGRKCYPSVADIDGDCDVAVVALPAGLVPEIIAQCGQKGIRYAIVFGGGFRETGAEGARIEAAMLAAARAHNVRIVGPNCTGLVNVHARAFAAFGSLTRPPVLARGHVSAVVQSSGFGISVVARCALAGIGFRHLVASGNESDISASELIDSYVDDPETRVIFAYLEGVTDGRAFMATARRALAAGKPLIVLKAGNTQQGKRAAASHTANLTGTYAIYQAAFRQCGVIEACGVDEAVDFALCLGAGRLPKGRSVALMGGSGGSSAVFSDMADSVGLTLSSLTKKTTTVLEVSFPSIGSYQNPIDYTAGRPRPEDRDSYLRALQAVLADPGIHQLTMMFTTLERNRLPLAAGLLAQAAADSDKPVTVFSVMPEELVPEGRRILREAGIPVVPCPRRLARAMGVLADYAEALKSRNRAPNSTASSGDFDLSGLPPGATTLDEHASKQVLAAAGVPVTRDVLLPLDAPAGALKDVVFPAAVKIVSRDILHKTDIGAVRLGIADASALASAAAEIIANARRAAPQARLAGVLVSEMITDGLEMIVGIVNDEVFGPVVALGLGGIFTEVLKDVTYRVAPFGLDDAHAMIGELKARKLLEGVRSRPPHDVDALARMLVRVSEFAWQGRERLAEMDINPLLVRPRGLGVVAADALLVLR